MPQTTTTPSSYPSYVYTNENNRIGLPPAKGEKKVRFTRFTHYMYRMKTTSNKLITNIL